MAAADLKLAHSGGSGKRPDTARRARGLKLARRIDQTSALVRQGRRRVKKSEAKGRKRTRRRLKNLRAVLEALEQHALTAGVAPAFDEDARRLLELADDHLDRVVGRKKPLKKRHLRRLRRDADDVARRLEALLTTHLAEHDAPGLDEDQDAPCLADGAADGSADGSADGAEPGREGRG